MQDLQFGNEFLGMTPKPQATKEKTDNALHQINFYASKTTIKKVKRQRAEWEKNYTSFI